MFKRRAKSIGKEVGWIASTDSLLLFVIILLGLSSVAYAGLSNADKEKRTLLEKVDSILSWLTETDTKLDATESSLTTIKSSQETISNGQELLNKELSQISDDLSDTRNQLLAELKQNNSQPIEQLKQQLLERDRSFAKKFLEFDKQAKEAAGEVTKLRNELSITNAALREVPELLKAMERQEEVLRQELIGLKGKNNRLEKVVFIVDTSTSMGFEPGKGKNQTSDSLRWQAVKVKIKTWIRLLPIKEFAIVTFNESAMTYPQPSLYFKDAKSRDWDVELEGYLSDLRSYTNTLAGIEAAYEFRDANAFVLFTDGAPTKSPVAGTKEEDFQTEIKTKLESRVLTARNAGEIPIPINVVGVADYLDPSYGRLLQEIASITGGCFIGQ